MKLFIANMPSDLTSGQRFDLQRSMFTELKHKIFQFSFFVHNFWSIGSRAIILASLCFSRQDDSNDTHFDPERSIWKFDLRSRSGQVKLGHIAYHRFGAMRQTHWCHFHLSVSSGSRVMSRNMFSHRLIMGEVKNWPDLVSRNWKIRDIHFVGVHVRIWSWKFQVIRTKTVSLARP